MPQTFPLRRGPVSLALYAAPAAVQGVPTLAESFLHPSERTNKHAVHPQPRPRDRVLIYTAAYTGMRAGELLALTRADVDLLRGVVHVRRARKDVSSRDLAAGDKGLLFGPTKTGANRTISLPKFLREMLTDYLGQPLPGGTGGPEDLVFPSSNGLPMRHTAWYRRVYRPEVKRALPRTKSGQACLAYCFTPRGRGACDRLAGPAILDRSPLPLI